MFITVSTKTNLLGWYLCVLTSWTEERSKLGRKQYSQVTLDLKHNTYYELRLGMDTSKWKSIDGDHTIQ